MNSQSLSADSHTGIRSITRSHDMFAEVIIFTKFWDLLEYVEFFFKILP